ncbi:MAG: D-2-hydroxyacid dehydrogenase [Pseudomonadales bacterium]
MKGVILDADSLGPGDVSLAPVTELLDRWDVHGFTPADAVEDRIKGAAVVLSNKVSITRDTIARCPELKFISVMATGTNNIDLAAAREANIPVSNAVAYATPSVVQHTLSLMLALSNNLLAYVDDVRRQKWQASKVFCLLDHPIVELGGKTLGIVGYGELGKGVAQVARAFDMQVLLSARPGQQAQGERLALAELLPRVDYLSLHCPLTPQTENLINKKTLATMKPEAFVINTARGGLINSTDLIAALQAGTIAGAALDVVTSEPPAQDELVTNSNLPNLIVTPHNAWGAVESRQRLVAQMQENITAFMSGNPVRVVNPGGRKSAD